MESLNKLLAQWNALNDSFSLLKKEKEGLELQIRVVMRDNHWKDYNHAGVHVAIVDTIKTELDQSELPLLLSKGDIEKLTRRTTVKKLFIVSEKERKKYNAKLRRI